MGLVLRRPGVDQETCWHEHAAGDHGRGAELGFPHSVVPFLEDAIDAIVQGREDLGAEREAHAHGDVVQAGDTDAFVVALCPEDGEGGEDEIHQAVEVCGVDSQDLDDGLGAEEAEGADEAAFEGLHEGAIRVVVFRVEILVAGFLHEGDLFVVQEFRGVCFAQEEEAGELDEGVGDGGRVEGPAPGGFFRDEPAGDGANRGTEEGGETVEGDGAATLFGAPAVAEDAAADCEGGGTAEAGEEAEGDHLAFGAAATGGGVEDEIE